MLRMVRAAFVVFAGCSFTSSAGSVDAQSANDATQIDGDIAHHACEVSAIGAETATTSLGGSGGSPRPDLACAAGELPIGIGFDSTQTPRPEGGNGANGERVVTAIHVRCGRVSLRVDESVAITPAETAGWVANQCGWGTLVSAPVVDCPANTVLVGISGNGGAFSLFNTVSITCASMSTTGSVGTTLHSVAVTDTGSYTNKPQTANCPTGTAAVSFAILGDCGVDEVTPSCSQLQCD